MLAFTMDRSWCSRSADLGVHDGPKPAPEERMGISGTRADLPLESQNFRKRVFLGALKTARIEGFTIEMSMRYAHLSLGHRLSCMFTSECLVGLAPLLDAA
jgi:hypothetical protein